MRIALASLAALLLAPLALSQAAPDSVGLPAVTVTAARIALPTAEASARVTVVGRAGIEDARALSAADVLDARTPVVVRRYGPSGLASVSVRGAGAAQALLLLDGQPLSDPQLGQVDVGLLPASLLQSVEVLSGAASGLYGASALGGVVHLRTPDAQRPMARFTTEAGPWGERRAHGLGTASVGVLRALVAAHAERSDGDYAVADVTRIGAPRAAQTGWDHRLATLFGRLAAETERGHVGASLWGADAERGLGGTDPALGPAVGERQWDRLARLGLDAAASTRHVRIEGGAALTRSRLRYANPYPAPASRSDALDESGRTTTATADLRVTGLHRPGGWTATGQVSAGAGRAEHPRLAAGAVDRFASLAASAARTQGRLRLYPALRADLYAPHRAPRHLALSPQLGANVALAERLRLKASAGRAFRMPTLNDRFWTPGGTPGLRPERGWTADAGLIWTPTGAQVEVTAFAARAWDQIVWSPTAGGYWSPENIARTRSLGVEASASGARALRLAGRPALADGGLIATLADARDLTTDQPLRYVPGWTAKAWVGLALGPVRFDLGARAVGRRFTTATASGALPAHLVLDAGLRASRCVGPVRLTAGLALDNLTDVRYASVRSHVMPPRHARLRLSAQSL